MASGPYYVLFAGVNGAGKSTLFRTGLWQWDADSMALPRVNADEILVANGWDWRDEAAQLRAGRLAVRQLHGHIERGESFNQETTLSGRSVVKTIREAREAGFRIIMFYVGLSSPALANERIRHRGAIGGHLIDPAAVERLYESSLSNLVSVIGDCAEAYLFDNTVALKLAARFSGCELLYFDYPAFANCWPERVIRGVGYTEVQLI